MTPSLIVLFWGDTSDLLVLILDKIHYVLPFLLSSWGSTCFEISPSSTRVSQYYIFISVYILDTTAVLYNN